jgi:hypothetical protein
LIYRRLELSEHDIQKSFFDQIRLMETKYPVLKLMLAVPNAAKRSYKLAAMLKAEGMRKGMLDVLFLVPMKGFAGLAIEFKKVGGKLTPEQLTYIDLLTNAGWLVIVETSADAAMKVVKNYLGI